MVDYTVMADVFNHGCRSEICVDTASVGTEIHANEGTVDHDLLVSHPQAKVVGSTNCIVCPDEGCLPDGAPHLTGDGCLVVLITSFGGKKALTVTKESTSFENGESGTTSSPTFQESD
ncbi:hypothetical protein L1887_24436 [Cichorium endivia]|nr:hypothetical protein L1887_24436 [Cichorium endivia]